MLRACTPSARVSRAGSLCRSMSSGRTPRRTSWLASISPVGPAPTIRTSVSIGNAPGLFGLRPRRLDHLRPLDALAVNVGAELLRRAGRGVEALIVQIRLDVLHME